MKKCELKCQFDFFAAKLTINPTLLAQTRSIECSYLKSIGLSGPLIITKCEDVEDCPRTSTNLGFR
jgi:hypothetical protein